MKYLNSPPAYNNCYHLVSATKYRKNLFTDKDVRDSIIDHIEDKVKSLGTTLHAVTVAYNHIHVLVEGEEQPSKLAQGIFGYVSFKIGKQYPLLKSQSNGALWGGSSCTYIENANHFTEAISYIQRHLPDNTKVDKLE